VPPHVNLQTTGHDSVSFSPNLYNSGYVCLSLLGTWGGSGAGENWIANTSTLLQVGVSIQSLIFMPEPFYGEPSAESSEQQEASNQYNAHLHPNTILWAMLDMLANPPAGFEAVVKAHFYLRQRAILEQCEKWITLPYASAELPGLVEQLRTAFSTLTEKECLPAPIPTEPTS